MDKASVSGAEDCRFESCHGRNIFFYFYKNLIITISSGFSTTLALVPISHNKKDSQLGTGYSGELFGVITTTILVVRISNYEQ